MDVSATEVESLDLLFKKKTFLGLSALVVYKWLFPLYGNQKTDFYSFLCAYLTVALGMNLSKDTFEPNTFMVMHSVQKALNKI